MQPTITDSLGGQEKLVWIINTLWPHCPPASLNQCRPFACDGFLGVRASISPGEPLLLVTNSLDKRIVAFHPHCLTPPTPRASFIASPTGFTTLPNPVVTFVTAETAKLESASPVRLMATHGQTVVDEVEIEHEYSSPAHHPISTAADLPSSYEALPPNFSLSANMLAGAFAGIAVRYFVLATI